MRASLRGFVGLRSAHSSCDAQRPVALPHQSIERGTGTTPRDPAAMPGQGGAPAPTIAEARTIAAIPIADARVGPIGARVRRWRSKDDATPSETGIGEAGAPRR